MNLMELLASGEAGGGAERFRVSHDTLIMDADFAARADSRRFF